MNKQKKVILGIVLLIVLVMGIGYAAITNVELSITGRATATANQENFKVYFTGENTVKSNNDSSVETAVTAKATTATVNFSGLTTRNDERYAILEIENGSADIEAESITVTATSTDTETFEVSAVMCDSTGNAISNFAVANGAKTYVKVSTKLLKTPTTDVNTSITATITAVPKAN